MDTISDLTYKVAAFRSDSKFNMNEAIDWAIDMIGLGYESESLFIIAGLSKPVSYFDGESYVVKALNELNIKLRTGEKGLLSYALYYVKKIALSSDVRKNLSMLISFTALLDDDMPLYDFRLLDWAWSDLEYGNKYQPYWPEANKDNIEQILVVVANKWIDNYKSIFS